MKIYGITTCSTVGKARKFMKDNNIDFDFVDYRKESVDIEKIKEWEREAGIDIIFNNKGKKYRDLGLKKLDLDKDGKLKWLAKENMLLKRPIIEHNGKVIVGYNEETYVKKFLTP